MCSCDRRSNIVLVSFWHLFVLEIILSFCFLRCLKSQTTFNHVSYIFSPLFDTFLSSSRLKCSSESETNGVALLNFSHKFSSMLSIVILSKPFIDYPTNVLVLEYFRIYFKLCRDINYKVSINSMFSYQKLLTST